jgi:hypothetical protein
MTKLTLKEKFICHGDNNIIINYFKKKNEYKTLANFCNMEFLIIFSEKNFIYRVLLLE